MHQIFLVPLTFRPLPSHIPTPSVPPADLPTPYPPPPLSPHPYCYLQELGVSERLAVLIEGESLVSDGTSVLVFSVFFNAATGQGSDSVRTVITQGLRLALGGPLVGFFIGGIG